MISFVTILKNEKRSNTVGQYYTNRIYKQQVWAKSNTYKNSHINLDSHRYIAEISPIRRKTLSNQSIWTEAFSNGMFIQCAYIAGRKNLLVDYLSRTSDQNSIMFHPKLGYWTFRQKTYFKTHNTQLHRTIFIKNKFQKVSIC